MAGLPLSHFWYYQNRAVLDERGAGYARETIGHLAKQLGTSDVDSA